LHELFVDWSSTGAAQEGGSPVGQEAMMRKILCGFLGVVLGGAVGGVVGGPLMVVVAAGLGGLAAYYIGSRFEPVTTGRKP
jgi:hypothetical protein